MPPNERYLYVLNKCVENVDEEFPNMIDCNGVALDAYTHMDELNETDKLKVAKLLKVYWQSVNKWKGKQGLKQKERVKKIKQILGE